MAESQPSDVGRSDPQPVETTPPTNVSGSFVNSEFVPTSNLLDEVAGLRSQVSQLTALLSQVALTPYSCMFAPPGACAPNLGSGTFPEPPLNAECSAPVDVHPSSRSGTPDRSHAFVNAGHQGQEEVLDQTSKQLPDLDANVRAQDTGNYSGSMASPLGTCVQSVPINQINPQTYSGDKATALDWIQDYENLMNINGYSNQQKLQRALAYLTGPARSWFKVTMNLNPGLEWPVFKKLFFAHFWGPDGQTQLRRKLDETNQKPDEHPSRFAMRILDMCLQYDPQMSERDKISRVTQGLHHNILNQLNMVKSSDEWTLEWLLKVFSAYKSREDRRETSRKPGSGSPKRKPTSNSRPGSPVHIKNMAEWLCFNCDVKGHTIENCPKPRDDQHIRAKKADYRAEKEKKLSINKLGSNPSSPTRSGSKPILPCDDIPIPTLTVDVNGLEVEGRIDSGADMSVIPSDVAANLKMTILPWKQESFTTANGTALEVMGMAPVIITHNNICKTLAIAVIDKKYLKQTLWGNDLLCAFSMELNFSPSSTCQAVPKLGIDVDTDKLRKTFKIQSDLRHPLDKLKIGDITDADRESLEETLIEFEDVFSRDENDIGRTSTVMHRINLKSDEPIHKQPYRVAIRNRDEMETAIKKCLSTGAFRPSTSRYASPVFFVGKDHGQGKRLVADYRALNAITVPDRQPMPHPEDVFSLLSGSKVYAKLDITSMFNQIEIDPRDVEKTAITTTCGLYECPLMPFGLMNGPATAVRLMKEVLRGINEKHCYVYFDDIIVFAADVCELTKRCKNVLTRLRDHNLKLKPAKCTFGVKQVQFLGHIISPQGVDIDPRRKEHVLKFPIPRNPRDVQSFHGICNYNRKFIKGFSQIAKPLTALMACEPAKFAWTTEAQQAFELLRNKLVSAPILVHFNPEADHELRTDASAYAIGAVLYQRHSDQDQIGTVLYWSRTLRPAEKNYSATERELVAAHDGMMTFKHYLLGKKFTLVTDHAGLALLKTHRDSHQRMARYIVDLLPFEYDLTHKSGSTHVDADAMSRLIEEPSQPTDVDVDIQTQTAYLTRAINVLNIDENANQDSVEGELNEVMIDMAAEQRQDDFCKKYIDILESDRTDTEKVGLARNFTMQENLLYFKQADRLVLVVPMRRRITVMLSCHEVPLAGHLGFSRTYSIIKARFFWPKMRKDIKQHVASCSPCQRRKISNRRKEGYTQPLPIAEDVFDTVGIDLISKLPESKMGYKAILVCTDNLSKYVITVPLRNETASSIIYAFFNHVVAKHGCPKLVISDRGANISGEKSRDFFRIFGIKRQLTSAYHPQSNGQTERFNRTLAVSLTMYVEKTQRDWPDYLQALTFAYNMSQHSVTRVSPYEVVFGRTPRLPIDNVMNRNEFVNPRNPTPGMLSAAALVAMKNLIARNQQTNKRRRDQHLLPSSFQEGDLVVIERPIRIKGAVYKMSYSYIGPYRIKRKISDLTFEICPLDRPEQCIRIHPCHMRKFIPRVDDVVDNVVEPSFIPRDDDNDLIVYSDADTDSADDSEEDIPSPEFEPFSREQMLEAAADMPQN